MEVLVGVRSAHPNLLAAQYSHDPREGRGDRMFVGAYPVREFSTVSLPVGFRAHSPPGTRSGKRSCGFFCLSPKITVATAPWELGKCAEPLMVNPSLSASRCGIGRRSSARRARRQRRCSQCTWTPLARSSVRFPSRPSMTMPHTVRTLSPR